MTTLDPEGMEKAARAIHGYPDATWRNETTRSKSYYRDKARAAVTAYLDTAFPEVASVEELDALPVSVTVMCADGWPWLHDSDGEGTWWWERAGHEEGFTSDEIPLPALVVHWGNE